MRKLITSAVALAVVGVGIALAMLIYGAKAEPSQRKKTERGIAVDVIEARRRSHRLDVLASGQVVAAEALSLTPEVPGRVAWLHEKLTPGTFVKKGQRLFRLDARAYAHEVARAAASVKLAETELQLEEGRGQAAKGELEVLEKTAAPGAGREPLTNPELVLRKPQKEAAKGNIAMAKASLRAAHLDLSKTTFKAPFDAVIVESSVAVGQLVTPSTVLGRLAATDHAHVRVSIPTEKVSSVMIPGIDGEAGSTVVVRQRLGEDTVERTGRVIRLLSSLEPNSGMARLLLEVDDPFGVQQQDDDGRRPYPLLLQSQVDVEIQGRSTKELVKLPRSAVRDGGVAYVVDSTSGRLAVRKLTIAWELPDALLVSAGVKDGERVIVSPLAGAVSGMKLRPSAAPETRD